MSSYQETIGIAYSGWSIYADGELSRMIASVGNLPIFDMSFVNTPFMYVQCSLNSLIVQKPFVSIWFISGSAYLERLAVKITSSK
jgi:hypothetical protein